MPAGFRRSEKRATGVDIMAYGGRLPLVNRLAASDPFFDYVVLLMGFDGVNGSNTFVDESKYARAVTVNTGAPVISNASSKFGGTSVYFNGSSRLYVASTSNGFGTGDFCIEYFADYRGGNGYKAFWNGGGVFFGLEYATTRQFIWNGSSTQLLSPASISSSLWQHHAVTRQSGTLRIFLDGGLMATGTWTSNLGTTFDGVIGGSGSGGQDAVTYMDELRITSGVARYTVPFTPPTSRFPRS